MTLAEGLQAAVDVLDEFGPDGPMQVVGGQRFLEVGSKLADKGQAVEELLKRLPLPGARLVYIGDDDKDEKAFAAIHKHGGAAILVASTPRQTLADSRLGSPVEVRRWLESILV